MATVTVKAAIVEEALFEDQWRAVADELRAAGHDVTGIGHLGEFRQLPPPPEVPDPWTVVIAIWVAKHLAGEAFDAVVDEVRAAVSRHLRGRMGKHTRKVEIVDERGEVLTVVEVPEGEAFDQPRK